MKKATPVQINWKPDKNNPVPLYQQIVDYIYQKISSGDWPVGTRLPSQRALAEQFDVNRSTITSALDEFFNLRLAFLHGFLSLTGLLLLFLMFSVALLAGCGIGKTVGCRT